MKMQANNYDIQMSSNFKTKSFGMEINAKAFDILVNKIYTDKIGAIVRELSANAYDSHVDAGKANVPFEIHLPNRMEEYFYIRDYGTGISEEKIYDVYIHTFKSDKTESNNFIGCMGLGSKTPFCYTDQFTIVSYYNGVQFCYFAHKDSRGIPSISASPHNGTPTNEPNGLKISFNVTKYCDYLTFANKVKQYLKYYKTAPNIIGGEINFELDSIILETENFILTDITEHTHRKNRVLMGNIPYDIPDTMNEDKCLSNLIYKVDIGEIDVEASREAIEDVENNRKIIQKFEDIAKCEIQKTYEEIKLDIQRQSKCQWDANQRINELGSLFIRLLSRLSTASWQTSYKNIPSYCIHRLNESTRASDCGPIKLNKIINVNKINDGGKIIFIKYYNDNKIKDRQYKWINDNFKNSKSIIFLADKENEVIKHFEILPEYITDVKDIPLNPSKPRGFNISTRISGFKKLVGDFKVMNRCWQTDSGFDMSKHILCCTKDSHILIDGVAYNPTKIYKILRSINCDNTIYGLNISKYKKLKSNNTLIEFSSWIKKTIVEHINSNKKAYQTQITFDSLDYEDSQIYDFLSEARNWLPKQISEDINCNCFEPTSNSFNKYYNDFTRLYDFITKIEPNFKIPLKNEVINGILKYKEKYKLIKLVEHEPEQREEFFKLFLGEKNAASN